MILCVQGPRPLLSGTSTEGPLGMLTGSVSSPHCLHSTPTQWDPTKDLCTIANNFFYLDTSGWYWGAITAGQAHSALQAAAEGAFLIRDSSHPLYMLTLSVRTARGPTSIRIQYSGARFLLDSSSPARPSLLSFPDVPSLIQYYVGPGRKVDQGKAEETHGGKHQQRPAQENTIVLKLKRALLKPQAFPSLQHLARLTINRSTDCPDQLPLPCPLVRFLRDYPFQDAEPRPRRDKQH
ncbi:cytokine-inducible SH2-containing protein isoform X1 [Esox lucius]|uniref:cytokine-inducible SH2-containing protein isoform X1 n=1 Tax=Esox lucius TaxID=8010 RepID=UPI00057705BC|nr:cytokine-inducible SH2-containing protein isoform X1 [Esox lucius]XP_010894364.1 cytokine-inducible SH2-containing protein isoform X1 [Esox lucius]